MHVHTKLLKLLDVLDYCQTMIITFTDDMSRYGYVFLMKHKSEAFEKFKEFRHEVKKQTEKSIKVLRSDRGGEYLSWEFLDYLKDNGIVSQWTPPETPQLNGVSEWRNRTLLDMVRSMMSFTDLSGFLCTQPNIAHAVSVTSRYQSNSSEEH